MNKIASKRTLLVAIFALGLSLLSGCGLIKPKMYVEEDALIGKTKDEILQIAFAEDAPRVEAQSSPFYKQVNIAYADHNSRHHKRQYAGSNAYFDDIEDARVDKCFKYLMESDVWAICPRRGILGDRGRYVLELTFKDGKVSKVRKTASYDFVIFFWQ